MAMNYSGNYSDFQNMYGGALATGLLALGIALLILFIVAVYVYTSLAYYSIAKKRGYRRPWLAWIPIANIAMWLQLGGFHWAWIFLILIPILGWIALLVLFIISTWKVFEKFKYPGWFSISLVIPQVGFILYLVAIGFVAWKKR